MPGDTRHYRIFTVNIIGDSNASSVASATTNRPPAGTLTVDGSPRVAEKLTANTSGVSDGDGLPAADQFSYQWVRVDGGTETNIPGATKSTYRPVQADLGKTLKVSLSYTDLATPPNPESVTSAATSAVNVSEYGEVVWAATLTVGQDGTSLGFDRTGPVGGLDPDTFGSVRVDKLSCDNGTAREFSPAGYESWTDGEHILDIGATTTYWLVGEMDSSTTDEFTFECSAIKWGANDNIEVRLTEHREPVGVPLISGLIDGEPREGKPLTAGIDHITEADGLPAGDRFRYQWFVDVDGRESEISGATGASYTPKLTDLGKKYRVPVEYTDNARFPESLTSVWTDPIEVHGNVIWSAELTVKRRTHSGLR